MYRHPRTHQEKRQAFSKLVRAKRRATRIPDSLDDIRVHHDKSWKSHRKTKWKEKP